MFVYQTWQYVILWSELYLQSTVLIGNEVKLSLGSAVAFRLMDGRGNKLYHGYSNY